MRWKPIVFLGSFDNQVDFSFHTLSQSNTLKILLSYSIWYLAMYQYCYYSYNRDPTSFFFDPAKGYKRVYSLRRERQANNFIKAANISTKEPKAHPHPSICLAIATVARSKVQYLDRTIGSLLEGLTDDQRPHIHLAVFFAQTDPRRHPAYNDPWLKNLVDEIIEYNVGEKEMARLHSLEENHQYWNKSMYDYEYLLGKCLETDARWTMLVEDDVLAREGWYQQAMDALEETENHMETQGWLYLPLFYTEKLFGWNSE